MTTKEAPRSIPVDPRNPGQFIACCGLLELAHRCVPGAEAWFEGGYFNVTSYSSILPELAKSTIASEEASEVIRLTAPFDLLLDWWTDDHAPKTWAGQQNPATIARAAQQAIGRLSSEDLFDFSCVLQGNGNVSNDEKKHRPRRGKPAKIEPFYFDARRFANSRDIGFSLNVQQMQTVAYPAVELLALIGLQRFRPSPASEKWHFDYCTWSMPLTVVAAAAAANGILSAPALRRFRFPLRFREDQKRYKAFGFAKAVGGN